MLSRAGYATLATGLGLFTAGVGLGNYALLLVGAFPLALVLVAARRPPAAPSASRTIAPAHPRRGDAVEIKVSVRVPAGRGLVEVAQPLPDAVELVEGSNVHVLPLGKEARIEEIRFRVRAVKRGRHEVKPLALEAVSASGLLAPAQAQSGDPFTLEVAPRVLRIGRIRTAGVRARTLGLDASRARQGVATTDFKELRDYRFGDPPRAINWKATARRMSATQDKAPVVNEHEREGRTAVWIFVDASTAMEVGTNLENGLEHALEAATGVAAWYLDHGYRVGAYVYNARDAAPVFADTGRRQLRRISEELVRTLPAPPEEGLDRAVQRCRPHLERDAPFVVVITRVGDRSSGLLPGLRVLRRFAPEARRRSEAVLLVDVRPHRLQPLAQDADRDAAELADGLDGPLQAQARRLGAAHMRWDPAKGPFAGVFLRGRGA